MYKNFCVLIGVAFLSLNCMEGPLETKMKEEATLISRMFGIEECLSAERIVLQVSNSSLSPDYQFSKEWHLTATKGEYRETFGEEVSHVVSKPMSKRLWEEIRLFDSRLPHKQFETLEVGDNEAWLVFYSKNKEYRFPAGVMPVHVSKIELFFSQTTKSWVHSKQQGVTQ